MAIVNSEELLTYAYNQIDELFLCSQEPTTYTEASATYKLAQKTPPIVNAPDAASPNGFKLTVQAITDGEVTTAGTATHWALCLLSSFESGNVVFASGPLVSSKVLVTGVPFTLDSFSVRIPVATTV